MQNLSEKESAINTKMIKERIKALGFTQKDVAFLMELSPSVISQKINNERSVTLKQAEQLSEILDITSEEFGTYFFD